jgi:hypothetical protein
MPINIRLHLDYSLRLQPTISNMRTKSGSGKSGGRDEETEEKVHSEASGRRCTKRWC